MCYMHANILHKSKNITQKKKHFFLFPHKNYYFIEQTYRAIDPHTYHCYPLAYRLHIDTMTIYCVLFVI